ncbi:hypothetical protein [Bacillus sp. 179-C3.3 HS]|uniref:hypothetical protein n=1 Tax=Bacillus sp. 179-C3.3 HS TaxID=3232162 RepID=UPI0039A1AC76
MERTALRKMRLKQVAVSNLLTVIAAILFYGLIYLLSIQLSHFFLGLGIVIFIQSMIGLLKKGSTKSLFPIFEEVAIYEKGKLGDEWLKEQRTEHLWRLVLSALLFFQSYTFQHLNNQFLPEDAFFLLIIVVIMLIFLNISLLLRFKKIDNATNTLDLKGYTTESYMVGFVMSLLILLVTSIVSYMYLF